MDPNSAGSQFFIMVDKAPHLDGGYAAFGKVIEGMVKSLLNEGNKIVYTIWCHLRIELRLYHRAVFMETVDAIVSGKTDWQDRPRQKQVMKKVTVDAFGVDYPEPEKI